MSSPVERGRPRSSAVSPRELAEIARAGSSIVRQPSMRVAYEVHHISDRVGYLYDVLRGGYSELLGNSKGEPPPFAETISSAAYGVGVVVGTRALALDSDLRAHQDEANAPTVHHLNSPATGHVFRGTAVPNVSFIQESGPAFEGLIAIEIDPVTIRFSHCRAIRAVIAEISEVAAEVAEAPILSIQSPVQLPATTGIDQDVLEHETEWPRSSSLAVRFSIGLDRPSAELRLRIADAFAEFCVERGFGLWIADLRPGYRTGNWFEICHHDEKRVHRRYDDTLDGDTIEVGACLPVTLVGPARVGSTHAVLELLSDFPQVGVVACSGAIIDDIAFMHLQLTVNGVPTAELERLNDSMDDLRTSVDDPSTVLPLVLPLLLGKQRPTLADRESRRGAAGIVDYQTIVGPALRLRPKTGDRRALWFSWEVEGRKAELRLPLLALYAAFEDLGFITLGPPADDYPSTSPNVEYLICRHMANSVLRGKGKISFPLDVAYQLREKTDLHARLTSLSVRVQNAWRDRLDKSHRARELTVSWREFWLGHWTMPLD
jgi:hypothetical protein